MHTHMHTANAQTPPSSFSEILTALSSNKEDDINKEIIF